VIIEQLDDVESTFGAHPNQLRLSTWSIVRAVLLVAVGAAVVGVLVAASTALWWLAIGTAIAGAFLPAAGVLRRWMPGWLSITVVLLAILALTGLLGYRGYSELQDQYTALQTNAIRAATDIQASKQFGQVATEFGLVDKVRSLFASSPFSVGTGDAASAVQSAASSGGALFAIGMLALLMLVFGPRMVRGAIGQIASPGVSSRVSRLVGEAYRASSRYVWLMTLRAVVIGAISGSAFALAGFETPTALGLWFAVLSFVPGLGVVMAALPIAVYEGVTSYPLAVLLFLLAVLFQALDSNFVQSRIDRASVRVGPGLMIVATLFGLQLYGLGGVLVALALTIFAVALLRELGRGHDDVFTAFRALVSPPDIIDSVAELMADNE